MEFESKEGAFQFYNEYGRIRGFSINYTRLPYEKQKDGLLINRRFVCRKEGEKEKDKWHRIVLQPRRDTRTKCSANKLRWDQGGLMAATATIRILENAIIICKKKICPTYIVSPPLDFFSIHFATARIKSWFRPWSKFV
ncbi:hypothetical protein RHMOL_Rhmol02G0260600 [Rhododendron molle]|nr:hypothetical protein RHMOL_Rhmol02G0260600 [Rhododendron molle]